MNKVAAYRRMIGMSQEEVANLIGISTNSYSNKERGVTQFKESEMKEFTKLISKHIPNIGVTDIFLMNNYRCEKERYKALEQLAIGLVELNYTYNKIKIILQKGE